MQTYAGAVGFTNASTCKVQVDIYAFPLTPPFLSYSLDECFINHTTRFNFTAHRMTSFLFLSFFFLHQCTMKRGSKKSKKSHLQGVVILGSSLPSLLFLSLFLFLPPHPHGVAFKVLSSSLTLSPNFHTSNFFPLSASKCLYIHQHKQLTSHLTVLLHRHKSVCMGRHTHLLSTRNSVLLSAPSQPLISITRFLPNKFK